MYSEILQKLLGESGAVAASIADYSSGTVDRYSLTLSSLWQPQAAFFLNNTNYDFSNHF